MEISKSVEIAKNEILADVRNGVVPATVKSFSDLHDYVDANTYGEICEAETRDAFDSYEGWVSFADQVFNEIDAWIESGEFAKALAK